MKHLAALAIKNTIIPLVILLTCSLILHAETDIQYPYDYRQWTHVKSMVIEDGHPLHDSFGGIHHIYANQPALRGYKTGKFPEGSIIIFDLLDVSHADHAISEQHRKVLGVMVKDSIKFNKTAGWGFEGFGAGDANNPVIGDDYKDACFACHVSQQDNDYVFSKWRD